MQAPRIRHVLPLLMLALAACSSHGGDAQSATSKAAASRVVAGSATPTPTHAQPGIDASPSGAMQALLAKLVPPAQDAQTAAALFHWKGDSAVPAGALGAGLDALRDAKSKSQAQTGANAIAANPAAAALGGTDPAAAQALEKKLADMSDTQRIAYAMQVRATAMQQPTHVASHAPALGATDAEADHRAQQAFGDALKRQQMWLLQIGVPFARLQSEVDDIRQHAADAHADADDGLNTALEKIPAVKVFPDGTGCYDASNAQGVHALDMQAADRHVAAADTELREVATWANAMRDDAHQAAVFTDTLSADLTRIRDPAARRMFAAQVDSSRTGTLGRFFDAYATSVRDFDLETARWIRARDAKRAEGVARWLCKG